MYNGEKNQDHGEQKVLFHKLETDFKKWSNLLFVHGDMYVCMYD